MELIKRKIKEINKCKNKLEIKLYTREETYLKESSLTLQYINAIELLNALDNKKKYEIFEELPLKPIKFDYREKKELLFKHQEMNEKVSNSVLKQFQNFQFDNNLFFQKLNDINFNPGETKIDFVRRFLKEIDIETVNSFDKVREDIIFYPTILQTNGRCFSFPDLDKYYIYINNNYYLSYIVDTYILAHEFGHVYEACKIDNSHDFTSKYNKFYTEVCSCFFDTIYTNYLIERYNLKDAILLKWYNLNEMLGNFKTIKYLLENKNILFEDSIFEILNYEEIIDKSNIKRTGDILGLIRYGYGRLLANYFASIYENNKEKSLIELKNFLSKRSILSNEELFDSLKIKDFSFLEEEIQKSGKQMKRIK